MRRFATIAITVVLALVVITSLASAAGGTPAAKVTAKVSDVTLLEWSETEPWTPLLENNLKTANQKDLFIDVSLECGLYTRTLVKGGGGDRDTSTAEAGVKVQVVIDKGLPAEQVALPGDISFCKRSQELTAVFGGVLEQCTDENGDGTITLDECTFTDEELELVLDTMNANSFNFVVADLGPGDHTITVEATINSQTDWEAGEAEAKATIGKGSVTVESVRMIQNEDIVLE